MGIFIGTQNFFGFDGFFKETVGGALVGKNGVLALAFGHSVKSLGQFLDQKVVQVG
jgi:hypothetical protein